jgi:hypothetical protein
MSKIQVISEKGKLVGTFILPSPPRNRKTPFCTPVIRRGEKLQELEVANAEQYYEQRKAADLHAIVAKKLKLKLK